MIVNLNSLYKFKCQLCVRKRIMVKSAFLKPWCQQLFLKFIYIFYFFLSLVTEDLEGKNSTLFVFEFVFSVLGILGNQSTVAE